MWSQSSRWGCRERSGRDIEKSVGDRRDRGNGVGVGVREREGGKRGKDGGRDGERRGRDGGGGGMLHF